MSLKRFFRSDFMLFVVWLNCTHENRLPGMICPVTAPDFFPEASITQQLYIEIKFVLITQTIAELEQFCDNHVLGRMDITWFHTVACGDFRIALDPLFFFRTCSNRSLSKMPFQRSLKAHHPVAGVIFALWHTWCKIVSFCRFARVDEFEHISAHNEENFCPSCGGQGKALISLTHT